MAEQLYRKRISPSAASNVDDLVSKNVLAQLRRDPPPRPAAVSHPPEHPPAKPISGASGTHASPGAGVGVGSKGGGNVGGGVEASDLISSMAKRLGALEREMKERQSLLQQVQADNAMLKSKLKVAEEEIAKRAMAAIEPRDDSAAVMHLRSENARLRAQLKYAWKQVAEMKAFLNDYGMIWMGDPEAEAELVKQGYGSLVDAASNRPASGSAFGAAPSGQPLSSEASEAATAARRTSHSGAALGPSSAAAAATIVGPGAPGAVRKPGGGLSPAAAAALERAGEKGAAGNSGGAGSGNAAAVPSIAAAPAGQGDKKEKPGPVNVSSGAAYVAAAAPPLGIKRTGSAAAVLSPTAGASRPGSSSTSSPRAAAGASSFLTPLPSAPAGPSARAGLPFSMAELQAKVDELNDLAGDGCGQVVRDAAGQHVLAMQDPVCLVIYRDGLQIHTLPAKPFNDPASNAVLRDILDGYFPYVLKQDFPDGVPLRVVDRSTESISTLGARRMGGAGAAAGGGGGGGNIRTFGEIDAHGGVGEPLTRDKFLSRLPQAVIKNGKVIEIRSDISRMLAGGPAGAGAGGSGDGGKADVALISTPVDALLSTLQRNHMGPSLPPPSREGQPPATEVTTLQVKSVDGKQTYILKLKYEDTIGSLRTCIDAHHTKGGLAGTKYEIRSAFPAKAYTEEAETLVQSGLVPNATLFLRPV